MEAEESAALAACIAQGERPFYYYCDDKIKQQMVLPFVSIC